MKNVLPLFFLVFGFTPGGKVGAQVTKLSNNTNIYTGIALGSKVILLANGGIVWSSDGTPAGTIQFTSKVIDDTSHGTAILNNKLYFSGKTSGSGSELWVTDGTDAGTSIVKDINPGSANSNPQKFIVYNNTILFVADDGTHGSELWKTDGTSSGTVIVKDINPGSGNGVDSSNTFFQNNDLVFFTANDGTDGTELWKTDGTSSGTVMVKDITAGSGSTTFEQFTALGTTTIFDRIVGSFITGNYQLWATDGTTSGTTLIKDFGTFSAYPSEGFVHYNGKLYFDGTDFTTTGTELWVTDGTPGGTALVKDINAGTTGSYPILFNAVNINSKFMFEASTTAKGSELWESDGTSAGTSLLKDIDPGSGSSGPLILANFSYSSNGLQAGSLYNGKVFFAANNGTDGTELWITDGTAAGTSMVKDINPGSGDGFPGGSDYIYTTSGLFFAGNDGSTGTELWKSDGTSGGTALVEDINPGSDSANPQFIGILNNHLYFSADDGDNVNGNRDLYIVNGTFSTLPVKLINFNATPEGKGVTLTWETSSEINSNYFSVERSNNGVDFAAIGQVTAAGNSNTLRQYNFEDNDAYTLALPALYYRLKMVDKDGAFTYSSVAAVRLTGSTPTLSVTPNPVQSNLNVDFKGTGAKKIAIRITDASGRQVYIQAITPGADAYRQTISVSNFTAGVYYLQLITDQSQMSTKFVKE